MAMTEAEMAAAFVAQGVPAEKAANYAEIMFENDITSPDLFPHVNNDSFREMGIKSLGHMIMIRRVGEAPAQTAPPAAAAAPPKTEIPPTANPVPKPSRGGSGGTPKPQTPGGKPRTNSNGMAKPPTPGGKPGTPQPKAKTPTPMAKPKPKGLTPKSPVNGFPATSTGGGTWKPSKASNNTWKANKGGSSPNTTPKWGPKKSTPSPAATSSADEDEAPAATTPLPSGPPPPVPKKTRKTLPPSEMDGWEDEEEEEWDESWNDDWEGGDPAGSAPSSPAVSNVKHADGVTKKRSGSRDVNDGEVMPPGWAKRETAEGKIFYRNRTTKTTHWKIPVEAYTKAGMTPPATNSVTDRSSGRTSGRASAPPKPVGLGRSPLAPARESKPPAKPAKKPKPGPRRKSLDDGSSRTVGAAGKPALAAKLSRRTPMEQDIQARRKRRSSDPIKSSKTLYDLDKAITASEQVAEDGSTILFQGFLDKQGSINSSSWKPRHILLTTQYFRYTDVSGSGESKTFQAADLISATPAMAKSMKNNCVEVVVRGAKPMYFAAEDGSDFVALITAFADVIPETPKTPAADDSPAVGSRDNSFSPPPPKAPRNSERESDIVISPRASAPPPRASTKVTKPTPKPTATTPTATSTTTASRPMGGGGGAMAPVPMFGPGSAGMFKLPKPAKAIDDDSDDDSDRPAPKPSRPSRLNDDDDDDRPRAKSPKPKNKTLRKGFSFKVGKGSSGGGGGGAPPPPPPPGPPPPPSGGNSAPVARPAAAPTALLGSIEGFKKGKLKKTTTVDKSAPKF